MTFIFDENAESCDDFLGGKIRLIQPLKGYRAGVDPVLLAAALPRHLKGKILDLGCGVGTAGLCALYAMPHLELIGIEADAEAAHRAIRNAKLNDFAKNTEIHHQILGDESFMDPLKGDEVDIAISNPPWFEPAHSQRAEGSRGLGRQEENVSLDIWIDYMIRKLRTGGLMAVIHRAHRLDDILHILAGRVGNIKIIPIWSKPGQAAKHVIILGHKARKTPLKLMSGFVMHDKNGQFLPEAKGIFMDGAALYYGEE